MYTDYERFESICVRYFVEGDDELKVCLFNEAQKLYKGAMLPKCDHVHWFIPKINYYHNLYLRLLKDNILYNLQKKDHLSALLTAQKGLNAEPYDTDFIVYQIICMDMQGNRTLAKNYYKRMEKNFSEEQKEEISQYICG